MFAEKERAASVQALNAGCHHSWDAAALVTLSIWPPVKPKWYICPENLAPVVL